MRHIYNFVFVVALVFALCGCSKPEPIVVRSLTLSSNAVAFDCDGGTKGVAVKPYPADMEWVVECDVEAEPWFEVDVVSGGVEVVARPNLTTSERVGSFNIVAKGENLNLEPYQVSVCQEAGRAIDLSISAPQSCTLDSEGDSYTFTVIAPTQWSVTSSAPWLEVVVDGSLVTFRTQANPDAENSRQAKVTIVAEGFEPFEVAVEQQSRKQNGYYRLLGKWEITASKWFYSPNGSLNELDYNPSQSVYNLIFDMEQGEYGKTFVMRNFLYPSTSLEVRYDKKSGNVVIPFGWSVLSYDVFLYITLVSSNKFSFASLEVGAVPSSDFLTLTLDMPSVAGYTYVGFGLWTYGENGNKVAVGSRSYPTMFPMGDIVFRKYSN